MRLSHVPLRVTTGAFLLSGGLGKRSLVTETTSVSDGALSPATTKALAVGEVALGGALLVPFVSPFVVGAGLTAFSGALLRAWWMSPGTHEEGSWRPTELGSAAAKDVWLLGTGLALALDGLTDGARRSARRTGKAARRRTKAVREALPVG